MLATPPPTGYRPFAMNQQNLGQGNTPGQPLTPLGMSASSYAPASSMSVPSSAMTPSSYMQPSSQFQASNIPQNPDPNPQAQNQIAMMLKALQGGIR